MVNKQKTPQNLEIWEQHYTNNKGTKEPPESFQTFQKYLHTRNLRKLAEEIIKEENPQCPQESPEMAELVRKKHEQLKGYSKRYDYRKRAEAYDVHMAKENRDNLEKEYCEGKVKVVKGIVKAIDKANVLIDSADTVDKFNKSVKSLIDLSKCLSDNEKGYTDNFEVKNDVKVNKYGALGRLFSEEELEEMREDLRNTDDIDEPLDDDFSEFE